MYRPLQVQGSVQASSREPRAPRTQVQKELQASWVLRSCRRQKEEKQRPANTSELHERTKGCVRGGYVQGQNGAASGSR
jgi:hypothetical protein